MNLMQLSKKTNIPYTTLKDWERRCTRNDEDWRCNLLEGLQDIEFMRKNSLKKIKNIFTKDEFFVVASALFVAGVEYFIEGEPFDTALEKSLNHYIYFNFDSDFDWDKKRKEDAKRGVYEKIKQLCEFDCWALWKYIWPNCISNVDGSMDLEECWGNLSK